MREINLTPYTISTATTGSCAFVEYVAVALSLEAGLAEEVMMEEHTCCVSHHATPPSYLPNCHPFQMVVGF
jgi:hypothetical protein